MWRGSRTRFKVERGLVGLDGEQAVGSMALRAIMVDDF